MELKETDTQPNSSSAAGSLEQRQRRRMLVALALLLAALVVVLVKDRQFWMSPATPGERVAEEAPVAAAAPVSNSQPGGAEPAGKLIKAAPSLPHSASLGAHAKKGTSKPSVAVAPAPPPTEAGASGGAVISATNRTVLPPLQIEVVAGNQLRPLAPKNNSVKVDMDSSASFAPPGTTPPEQVTESQPVQSGASANVTVPPATAQRVTRSVKPEYPVLAKQMKVQGAVVLQALIDKGGRIEELHVVTGPSILASAAQEAVKQWRFKPYYQQGQAVETEARITVNFTISTY